MTTDQLRLNLVQFNDIVSIVRQLNPTVADLLMANRYPLERHVEALELKLIKEEAK